MTKSAAAYQRDQSARKLAKRTERRARARAGRVPVVTKSPNEAAEDAFAARLQREREIGVDPRFLNSHARRAAGAPKLAEDRKTGVTRRVWTAWETARDAFNAAWREAREARRAAEEAAAKERAEAEAERKEFLKAAGASTLVVTAEGETA